MRPALNGCAIAHAWPHVEDSASPTTSCSARVAARTNATSGCSAGVPVNSVTDSTSTVSVPGRSDPPSIAWVSVSRSVTTSSGDVAAVSHASSAEMLVRRGERYTTRPAAPGARPARS